MSRPRTTLELKRVRRMVQNGLCNKMIALAVGRTDRAVNQCRHEYVMLAPAKPYRFSLHVSENCYGVLAAAGRTFDLAPARIAASVLECVAGGALDLLPHVLPPRPSAPMASLFAVPMSARMG